MSRIFFKELSVIYSYMIVIILLRYYKIDFKITQIKEFN